MLKVETKEQKEALASVQKKMWHWMRTTQKYAEKIARDAEAIEDQRTHLNLNYAASIIEDECHKYEQFVATEKWDEERVYRVHFSGIGINDKPYSDCIDIRGRFMAEIEYEADFNAEARNAKVTKMERMK